MRKQKLKLLELAAIPTVIDLSQITADQNLKYVFTAHAQQLDEEPILTVTFFSLATKTPAFRVFFNLTAFITQRLTPKIKWSESTLDYLITYWHGKGAAACADEQSARLIKAFFSVADEVPPYLLLQNFQNAIRGRQLAARHKRETDQIDQRMKGVGQLPINFTAWVNEVALDWSRYIYYKRQTKRRITGFYTSCARQVEFKITPTSPPVHVGHNQSGICPACRKKITFKAVGKTTTLADTTTAALIQKIATGFVVRYFNVFKEYKDHYQQPTLTIRELVRDFYDGSKMDCYEYANFKQTNQVRWCHSLNKFHMDTACLYTRNLRHVLVGTEFKYSGLHELARHVGKFNIYAYLKAYQMHPAYEYLVKLQLYRLIIDNIGFRPNFGNLNFDGKDFHAVLGVNALGLRQMQRLNGTLEHLKLIQAAGTLGVTLTDQELSQLVAMGIDRIRLEELLGYTTPHKVITYITHCLSLWPPQKPAPFYFSSREADIAADWSDYLTNCTLLGYDLKDDFLLFPRNLKARHDEVMKLFKAQRTAILEQAIATLHENLCHRYDFLWQGILVRLPASMAEIIAEGHKLHHCVGSGSYIENMAQGKCLILFIRQAGQPDTPFFTLELRDNMVIQCRGKNNCSTTQEVTKFIATWNKKLPPVQKRKTKKASSRSD